jgi:hypothetical protein
LIRFAMLGGFVDFFQEAFAVAAADGHMASCTWGVGAR